ncbi:hypothetical protein [Polymorphobacter megasporae]|uniref:hypothetical protein n=1 Tax=Glacieibacterium megasporae TaxID=2835787 RepID=UPI001C1E6D3F|nr:hypothetical protein [Polymorphobacter megasporae]UAJ09057.1 hypothetical protein KTC28_11930 [Polymorphobacter megasporae]
MNRARSHDDGSVLIEAMVAVAIIAAVLAVTYRSLGENALRLRAADSARTATMIAQSRLAAVGSDIPLAPGETDGTDGAFAWTVTIDAEPAAASTSGNLLRVSARVRDIDGRADRARLDTLRLATVR